MKHCRPQRLALAMASLCLTLAAPGGHAAVTVSGSYQFDPGGPLPIGPGSLSQPGRTLWVGTGGGGSFAAGAGSTVDLGALFISAGGHTGSVLLDGAGTRLTLGRDDGGSRLEVGNYGDGTLTVSGGARLDASAACQSAYCGSAVSNSTGSTGLLTITGAGSSASFMSTLFVANGGMDNRFDFGRPGLTSNGQARVLAGGLLQAGSLHVASVYPSPYGANGQERAVGQLTVSGAGSRLVLDGQGSWDAGLNIANGARADGSATLTGGAQVLVAPVDASRPAWVRVGSGGQGRLDLDGAGTELRLQAAPGMSYVHVADGGASNGTLRLTGGAGLSGMDVLRLASTLGNSGVMVVSGAGSRVVGGSADAALYLGAEASPSGHNQLRVDTGGSVQMGRLVVGVEQPGQNNEVVLTGSGSRIALNGTHTERLYVANGSVTVSDGALLDARADEALCAGGVWCATKIGTLAGGSGALTVQGAGSVGRFTGHFQVGVTDLATPAADGWTRGTPGGRTTAQLRVLDGGVIQTDHVTLGLGTFSAGATGGESAQVDFTVQGAGSRFEVLGSDGLGSYLQTVTWNARNTRVDMAVLDGGVLALQSHQGNGAYLNLSVMAGSTRMRVSGAGSALTLAADAAGFTNILMARSDGSFAELAVSQGGRVSGNQYLGIGMAPGAVGVATISGAGSAYASDTAFAQTAVGTNGGQGTLAVSSGGQLQMAAGTAFLSVGTGTRNGVAATGLLRVDGGTAQVLGRYNPQDPAGLGIGWMHVGNDAQGSVQITNGGRLLIDSDGPASAANGWMGSGLVVGKSRTQPAGGQLLVSGAGSRIDTTGTNPFITLGSGAMGSGMLRVAAGGTVATTLMGVGDAGGTGTATLDAGTLRLDGAWRSGTTMGASLVVASGGGTGIVSLANGSQLLIHADGQERGTLAVGGAAFAPGGVGVLRVDSGSAVRVTGGGGGQVLLAATPGGIGTLTLAGGSTLAADYVGVGADNGQDTGGVATLVVNDTSVLSASTLEIGAKGYVGGTGTLIGNVINRGTFSPGNSPGTLHVQGSFANQAGGRLVLEVQADGRGGFVTDQLVFDGGSPVSLASLAIEFRFLGATDPNAFQASGGFQIDSFLRQGSSGLDHTLLAGASYSASSSAYQFNTFSFNADGGAVFQAQAVPEPQTWMLFAAGLGLSGWIQRRRTRRG